MGFDSLEAFALTAEPGYGEERLEVPGEWASRTIGANDELCYVYFPVAGIDYERLYAATGFALDLEFEDGTWASDAATVGRFADGYDASVTPQAQYDAKMLWVDQWNRRSVSLDAFAGRVVRRVVARLSRSPGTAVTGFLDGVTIGERAAAPEHPLGWVSTTRGTHSSGRFSRGNTAPIVAIPHGGVFGIPMTDAAAANWPYAYHEHNRSADNRPAVQAFATSHLPSPWIGDRGVFQVMPSPLATPDTDRTARALGFDHDREHDGPHLYEVQLDGGVHARMTAADFALALRFEFATPAGSLILDHHGTVVRSSTSLDGDTTVIDLELDDRADTPHHYVHVRVPRVVADRSTFANGRLGGHLQLDLAPDGVVDVLIGISTIGSAEAAANLRAAGDFNTMLAEAARLWTEKLATVELAGAPDHVLRNVYSGLYRLFLYPNRHSEAPDGSPRYRSPFGDALAAPLRETSGSEVRPGLFSANNGFWDTYRTCWPALNLLTPDAAGRLAQGFVQHFVDSGWTSRWSAPGAVDCMTGTTSDTVFGDAAVKAVPHVDLRTAYRSAVKNATVPAPDPRVGRKGIRPGIFRGYVSTATHEGMSWTLDNAINDWAIAQLADVLRRRATCDVRRGAGTLPGGARVLRQTLPRLQRRVRPGPRFLHRPHRRRGLALGG